MTTPLSPATIMDRLGALYGEPVWTPHGDAIAELILTVLSQNTADTNSGRAFTQLLRRYPSWAAIAAAPAEEVVATIQPGGLAQQKAPRIQSILRAVGERSPGGPRIPAPCPSKKHARGSVPFPVWARRRPPASSSSR